MEIKPRNPPELSRSTPESGRLLKKRVLLSRRARVGRQSAWAGHQHGCRAFVLEPVSSGPKNDTDTDLGTHPQPSRDGYLRPELGGLQPGAKRKHVGGGVTELLREKRAQRAAPSRCLVADSQFASLGNARPAQAPVGGACAGELTERRRPARGDLFHPCPCVMTSWAREAALQQLRLRGLVSARCSCGARCKSSLRIKIKRP